ncbi:response regulator transcription factor [Nocardioides nitrophenolicus]|uniref:response regulator transcription factor n=1 Tax=Nocardioides nitrophenolicus TaxID=60489 RepID=UPI00195E177B|nr:response regulator transcription factor [Nocardioides nitrophenolicus]MBM7520300.1 DNA-binding NarL/FixJ family response regulator [Nocardioides nitrophenolicus]
MSTVQRRVAILDDHELLAESLEIALSVHGYDVRRVPVPADGGAPRTLVDALVRLRPRVLLLDLDLGSFGDATVLVAPLRAAGVRVVVLTGETDRARWGRVLAEGAHTVLSKASALIEVISTVRRVDDGHAVLTPEERAELIAAWRERLAERGADEVRLARLSPREARVLGLLMEGMHVRDIAVDRVVSEATVRSQVHSILTKLDVSSQLAAVTLAHRSNWRPPVPA